MPSNAAERILGIELLGGVRLAVQGAEIELAGRKARGVLAFLAASGGVAARDRLAGLFWGDTAEANARGSLRQVVFDMRETLRRHGADCLLASRTELRLAPGRVQLDIAGLVDAVEAGEVPEPLLRQPRLADTLLLGFEDVDAGFQTWLVEFRAAQHDRLRRALARGYADPLAPRARRRQMAEAALLLDPTDEEACRCAMRLAAEDGAIGQALRAYDGLYQVLGDELDMEPSAATQALVCLVKQGQIAPSGPVPAAQLQALPTVPAAAPRVAVLPFRSIGPDAVPSWFAEGLCEEIVCTLAALREPVVVAGRVVPGADGGPLDVAQAGRALGARYVLSGAVRQAASMLRLTVQLTAVDGGAVLWARGFDATDARLFEAQVAIAASVANTLAPQVQQAELRTLHGSPPEGIGCYHLMLRARHLMAALEQASFAEAGALLRQAIDLEPGYAAAHATFASWLSLWVGQRWSRDPVADELAIEAAVGRAVALDPQNARALSLLGHSLTTRQRRYDEALRLFGRALEAAPNDAAAWLNSSPSYAYLGDGAEAVRRAENALSLAPEDPFLFRAYHFLAIAHYVAGDYPAAVDCGRRSMLLNPRYLSNLRLTAGGLVAQGRIVEAAELCRAVMAQQPGFRIGPLIANHPFRDVARRQRYEQQLLLAGFPA